MANFVGVFETVDFESLQARLGVADLRLSVIRVHRHKSAEAVERPQLAAVTGDAGLRHGLLTARIQIDPQPARMWCIG